MDLFSPFAGGVHKRRAMVHRSHAMDIMEFVPRETFVIDQRHTRYVHGLPIHMISQMISQQHPAPDLLPINSDLTVGNFLFRSSLIIQLFN